MTPFDAAGLLGVVLMLGAYAAAQARWLDPLKPRALLMNLVGAGLVLVSMIRAFNLAAFVMESAWAIVALYGLIRFALARWEGKRRGP
jgi:hypothetical protein